MAGFFLLRGNSDIQKVSSTLQTSISSGKAATVSRKSPQRISPRSHEKLRVRPRAFSCGVMFTRNIRST